jgi:hypothetical protein
MKEATFLNILVDIHIIVIGIVLFDLFFDLTPFLTLILIVIIGGCALLGWVSGFFKHLARIQRKEEDIREDMHLRKTPLWLAIGLLALFDLVVFWFFSRLYTSLLLIVFIATLFVIVIYGLSRRSMEDS